MCAPHMNKWAKYPGTVVQAQVSTPLAKVIIMDRDGSATAREVARALRKEGVFSAYVMEVGVGQGRVRSLCNTTCVGGRGVGWVGTGYFKGGQAPYH